MFVDVGANDYRHDSTTYYLETALGWHVIAVDAQREYAAGYQQYRPRTEYFTLFVSDQTDATAGLYIRRIDHSARPGLGRPSTSAIACPLRRVSCPRSVSMTSSLGLAWIGSIS